MTAKNKLIFGGSVITMNPQYDIYERGWLLVEGDIISAMGEGEPPKINTDVEYINAKGKAVMPGIVNAHTHVCGALFKALTEDRRNSFYELALPMEQFLTSEATYVLSMSGCIEAVKFGSTCINDLYHHMVDTAKAVDEIGIRGSLAQKIYEVDLRNLQYNDYSSVKGQGEKKLEENIRLIEEYHGKSNGRISCRFGPHATDTVSMDLAKKIADLAEHYNVGVHTHAAQIEQEVNRVKEIYGLSPIEYLKETGLAGKKLTAAHCIYIDDNDTKILKQTKTGVLHCPELLMKRGEMPSLKKFYGCKLKVALGSDWLTLNPWDNMRFAIAGARMQGFRVDSLTARDALRMATIGAAEVVGMENYIGSLEIGKKADLIIMDLSSAHLQPIFDDIVATIVYNANGTEIETVIVDGNFVVRNSNVVNIDEQTFIREASLIAKDYYGRL